jgi:hypothetical protein
VEFRVDYRPPSPTYVPPKEAPPESIEDQFTVLLKLCGRDVMVTPDERRIMMRVFGREQEKLDECHNKLLTEREQWIQKKRRVMERLAELEMEGNSIKTDLFKVEAERKHWPKLE